jgi:hypothetical protein
MKHLTEEQIILHCYGDTPDGEAVDRHLTACPQCRAEFEEVKALLAEIPPTAVPDPPEYLEQKIWLNVRDKCQEPRTFVWGQWLSSNWAIAGIITVLVIAAFLAGRFSQHSSGGQRPAQEAQISPERVVLVAVGDHLERSQMLLVELMHGDSKDSAEVSSEQKLARNLLEDNRLYRQSALRAGDPEVAHLLDQLERVLVEIANSPSDPSATDLHEIRSRIQSQDLLFKIHVVEFNVTRSGETLSQAPTNPRI